MAEKQDRNQMRGQGLRLKRARPGTGPVRR